MSTRQQVTVMIAGGPLGGKSAIARVIAKALYDAGICTTVREDAPFADPVTAFQYALGETSREALRKVGANVEVAVQVVQTCRTAKDAPGGHATFTEISTAQFLCSKHGRSGCPECTDLLNKARESFMSKGPGGHPGYVSVKCFEHDTVNCPLCKRHAPGRRIQDVPLPTEPKNVLISEANDRPE